MLVVWLGLAFESSGLLLPAVAAVSPPASVLSQVYGWVGRTQVSVKLQKGARLPRKKQEGGLSRR